MSKTALKLLHVASLIAGVGLFVYLIYRTGLSTLAHHLDLMGWGFGVVILISLIRNLTRAGSWYYAISPEHRSLSYWKLLNVMLACESIKFLTSTGPFIAEPAKAALVRDHVPLLQGFSSVFVENVIYYLTVFIFMFVGVPALVTAVDLPDHYWLAGSILLSVLVGAMAFIWFSVRTRWYPLARLLDRLARRKPSNTRLADAAIKVREVETTLYSFYETRRGAFAGIFGLNIAAHATNILELYYILSLFEQPVTLPGCFVMEAVTKMVNFAFFFVPTQAGVYESAHALIIGALGMSASAGLALGVVRKLRAFFWAAYGLVAMSVLTLRRRGVESSG
jgi:hypothetical protein